MAPPKKAASKSRHKRTSGRAGRTAVVWIAPDLERITKGELGRRGLTDSTSGYYLSLADLVLKESASATAKESEDLSSGDAQHIGTDSQFVLDAILSPDESLPQVQSKQPRSGQKTLKSIFPKPPKPQRPKLGMPRPYVPKPPQPGVPRPQPPKPAGRSVPKPPKSVRKPRPPRRSR